MNKYLNIIALENPNNPFEAQFYTKLKTYYSDLFSIYIIDAIEKVKGPFDAIFSFTPIETLDKPHLLFSPQLGSSDSFYVNQEILDSADTILRLSRYLNNFYQKYSSFCLRDFPYQLRISDKDGHFTFHNQQFNGTFFPDQTSRLEPWLYQQLSDPERADSKHLLLPSASLDHIYFQSYYAIRDHQKHYLGSIDIVQDLKPILSQYLDETAQAIVGWSDVTSGPSISDDN